MSDSEEKPFCVERAKIGRAACKKCKEKCLKDEIRIAKLAPSPFGEGKMKNWHHVDCLFEQFLKQRQNTKRLQRSDELDGWETLSKEDQDFISAKFEETEKLICEKYGLDYVEGKFCVTASPKKADKKVVTKNDGDRDNSLREFRRLVADITNINSYNDKTAVVKKMLTKGSDGDGFKGDVSMWCRLLLPGVIKRVYNLQSKQLVKLFSRLFETNLEEMLEHLEAGDIGETIQHFFEKSKKLSPAKKSLLSLGEVDEFLDELSKLTKEEEQLRHFKALAKKCTGNDLKTVIRLIKHDLRMQAGAKHILDGLHPDAYQNYQTSRDLNMVIERLTAGKTAKSITLLTPVLPMLAEPCKSIEQAFKKCPNGIYSEIKYDGERVQLHKKGTEFKYFSRSLKPVMQHKIAHFKNHIPEAFPHGRDLILDCEILMVDLNTGQPLPFGTLGSHKKDGLKSASVCLFVFDCLYYNGEDLTTQPLSKRKRILKESMTEIKNHIVFSEMKVITEPKDLAAMITKVLKMGLEGLVLKDAESVYKPGKRHWLKVKKDYLFEGAMADSADLIVLGAWYGTGKKGGIMSVFLMGLYDPYSRQFCTVTKVHTGHDDKTLERLQSELKMKKISGDYDQVPSWLKCTKTMVPDFVAEDPKKQPVWEITGAEFTQIHDVHTANGISIRFPRVTRIRDDKTWETATNLQELDQLFKNSKENFDGSLFDKEIENLDVKLIKRKSDSPKNDASPKKNKMNAASPKKRKLDDDDGEKRAKTRTVALKNPLPNYFDGIKLFSTIENDLDSECKRLFVAFGGTVVSNVDLNEATHIVHECGTATEEMDDNPKEAFHVTMDWLNDSILNKRVLHYGPYLVRLV